jgi:ribonucleoside-triphosphate reductase
MCQGLFGKDHSDDKEVYDFALSVIKYMYDYVQVAAERNNLNFSLYATPAENLCYTYAKALKAEFGEIKDITDKEFITNSHHVPVWKEIDIFTKIDIEAPFCYYATAGCITYVEFDSKIIHNEDAVEAVIDYAMEKNVPYLAINFPIDTCLRCGYSGEILEDCPCCHGNIIEHLARVTGYLSTDVTNFNKGKQDEVRRRYDHSLKTWSDQ